MPQMWLPIFPKGITDINNILAYAYEGENITYYNGMMPIFTHHKDDISDFSTYSLSVLCEWQCFSIRNSLKRLESHQ